MQNRPISKQQKSKNYKQKPALLFRAMQFQINILCSYLTGKDIRHLKLVCRQISYLLMTKQIWLGIKQTVIYQKFKDYEDIQFTQEQAQISTKQEQVKRMHSLRKDKPTFKIRQASNRKQINQTYVKNQLPFRSTQIGFKRLLKTNKIIGQNKSIAIVNDTPIPNNINLQDLKIDPRESLTKNIHRATNLCIVVKKWNEQNHTMIKNVQQPVSNLGLLVKLNIKFDQTLCKYVDMFKNQSYLAIVQYLQGNILFDDQLTKISKLFNKQHAKLLKIHPFLEIFISKTHELFVSVNKYRQQLQCSSIISCLNLLQNSIDEYQQIKAKCPEIISINITNLTQIYQHLLKEQFKKQFYLSENCFILQQTKFKDIIRQLQFYETTLYSILSLMTKLLKFIERQQCMRVKYVYSNLIKWKQTTNNVWNIVKYFAKLKKQLDEKETKSQDAVARLKHIRQFLTEYQSYEDDNPLMNPKNASFVQKQLSKLKQRIKILKSSMQ